MAGSSAAAGTFPIGDWRVVTKGLCIGVWHRCETVNKYPHSTISDDLGVFQFVAPDKGKCDCGEKMPQKVKTVYGLSRK